MTERVRILVVEDDAALRETCVLILTRAGYEVEALGDGESALRRFRSEPAPQLALVDMRLPKMDGLEVLKGMRAADPEACVIVMTGYATVQTAVQAMKLGACDYIVKPFEKEELLRTVAQQIHLRDLEQKVERLETELRGRYGVENIVARSPRMEPVFERIVAASSSRANVLILGESGTGKELIARAIHYSGLLHDGPFVPVNCAALPASLVESELFGHTRGSFTGAARSMPGLFRAAEGGTIFLDEIFEVAPDIQVKLIRAIQERTVRPVGSTAEVPVHVRIIASSNQVPEALIASGDLRKDLFYRLSVITIRVPPLRERRDDVPALIDHFRTRMSATYGHEIADPDPAVIDRMKRYAWPGNVRELENLVEQWFAMGRKTSITLADLPQEIAAEAAPEPAPAEDPAGVVPLEEAERALAQQALEAAGMNKSKAANLLGVSRKKLYRLLEERPEATE